VPGSKDSPRGIVKKRRANKLNITCTVELVQKIDMGESFNVFQASGKL